MGLMMLSHHKNGVKTDNRIENLEITSLGKHAIEHGKGYEAGFDRGYSDGIDTRIKELEARVKLLETILYSKAREGEGRWEKRLS